MPDLQIVEDPGAAAAERVARALRDGADIVLTGGSTPKRAYAILAEMDLDWSGVTLWFSDERCVGPDHADSNYGMAKAALLDHLPADRPRPKVHRMEGEKGPQDGAAAYEEKLRATFGGATPAFDLLLLGLGPDGHCASLFPGQPSLDISNRLAVGVAEAGLEPFVPRITLTLPAINAAREVVFLVSGFGKAHAVRAAFSGAPNRDTPSSLVAPDSGRLAVVLDEPAAKLIGESA